MMFTIVFGLSMDYEVFLLSRMHEEWARSGDNAKAVADGLVSTARVITAAAAVMQLLGSANWWLPRWIGRAIPNLAIEPNVADHAGGGLAAARPVSAVVVE